MRAECGTTAFPVAHQSACQKMPDPVDHLLHLLTMAAAACAFKDFTPKRRQTPWDGLDLPGPSCDATLFVACTGAVFDQQVT
jgi:hypothetical protein